MNTRKNFCPVIFLPALLLCVAFFSSACAIDYISYVGAELDSEAVVRYRSSAVPKMLIANDGGIYATNGGINWEAEGRYNIGRTYLHSANQGHNAALQIDKLSGTPNGAGYCTEFQNAGYCDGTHIDANGTQMKFTQDFSRVRVGVMWDIKGTAGDSQSLKMSGVNVGDYTQSDNKMQNANFSTFSDQIQMTANAKPDIYFFDLVGVKTGDVFNFLLGNDNPSFYVGAFLVDDVQTSTISGKWNISFTDNTATNFLNSQGGLVNPARSLKDTSGVWTTAVARLEGLPAGNYDTLTLTGLIPSMQYYMNLQGAGGQETLKLAANAKGEITQTLDAGFMNASDLSVQMAWEQNAIYSVDFQSKGATMSMQNGNGDSILGLGDKWTIYDFNTWAGHGNANSLTDGYAKFLRDADGNDSQIYFSTEGSKIAGWHGDNGDDPLLRDYLFTGSAIHQNNPDFVSDPIIWEIGGLEAGDLYQLIMFGGIQRDAGITVNGAIDGDDSRIAPAAGTMSYWVYADAAGLITGSFTTGTGVEANWSGFHLLGYSPLEMGSAVPEPATWVMMLTAMMFGGVLVWRKRKNVKV